ncbi:putative restriction methylase [Escherichia coli]|uniref:Putative restriction methylase n=1 Tax=Escherichia coli TaxID=562 RepID=A0A377AK71_ECOLX|nr:putative restriction methylase [Escherichia coli]
MDATSPCGSQLYTRQLAEISAMTESIDGKAALDWAMKQDFRCGCWLMEKPETAMKAITRNLDSRNLA